MVRQSIRDKVNILLLSVSRSFFSCVIIFQYNLEKPVNDDDEEDEDEEDDSFGAAKKKEEDDDPIKRE